MEVGGIPLGNEKALPGAHVFADEDIQQGFVGVAGFHKNGIARGPVDARPLLEIRGGAAAED